MKHLTFIINPRSGTDRNKAIADLLEEKLDKDQFSYSIRTTEYAGHATAIAQEEAEKKVFAVVAVGGDGSVRETAAGLLHSGTALGIVPKGSGNGLARALKIPLDTAAAIELLNQAGLKTIDAGYANDELFLSNAGVGFDSLVSEQFAKTTRRGLYGYSRLVMKHLWIYRSLPYELTTDGKKEIVSAFMINAANGTQFGYNFIVAPLADLTDGLLDITIIRPFPKLVGSTLIWRALKGSILKSPYVRHQHAKNISIQHPELKSFQIDGDSRPCNGKVSIAIAPQALKILAS